MRDWIRLGQIAGVRAGLDISAVLTVPVLALGLAFGRFPTVFPGYGTADYVIAGAVAGVLFLASLLAHELAHAVAARRRGFEVTGITLWMLGGVSRLRGKARSPRDELRIAVAGPLASLAAAAVCGTVAAELFALTGQGLAVGLFTSLAAVNLLLAAINLLPAAPLDGGRVVRAVACARHGSPARAAVTAARAGRAVGYLLIAAGLAQVVTTRGLQGLWAVVPGLFLTHSATAEQQVAQAVMGPAGAGAEIAGSEIGGAEAGSAVAGTRAVGGAAVSTAVIGSAVLGSAVMGSGEVMAAEPATEGAGGPGHRPGSSSERERAA